jgi:methyl-accepting chemotaxis protein
MSINNQKSLPAVRRQASVRRRVLAFSVAFFAVIFVGGSGAFILAIGQIERSAAAAQLSALIQAHSLQFEKSFSVEISLALKMAHSPLIRRFLGNPADATVRDLAVAEFADYQASFTGNNLFYLSDTDKRYYFNGKYSYTLDPAKKGSEWYEKALNMTDPYQFNVQYDIGLKKTFCWVNVPVPDSAGRPVGICGTGIDLTNFINTIFENLKPDTKLYVFNDEGTITGARTRSLLERKSPVVERLEALGNAAPAIVGRTKTLEPGAVSTYFAGRYVAVSERIGSIHWNIVMFKSITRQMIMANPMFPFFIVIIAVVLVIFVIFNVFLFQMLRPLNTVIDALHEVGAAQDLSRRVRVKGNDEFGRLAGFFNTTFDEMRNLVLLIRDKNATLARTGNELAENSSQAAAATGQIAAGIQKLKNQFDEESAGVGETGASMRDIMASVDALKTRIDGQAAHVGQSAASIEEMIKSIGEVTETLSANTENIQTLSRAAEAGRRDVEAVSGAISEIAKESEGLLSINQMMQTIAGQTNLLSMNAAIEAAHAGQVGAGFAVVADEIRKLSESSAEQSKTIAAVLKKIKGSIDAITASAGVMLQKFGGIEGDAAACAEQAERIRASMERQSQNSAAISASMTKLNEMTDEVRKESDRIASNGAVILRQTATLERTTHEAARDIDEMVAGTEQISAAATRVSEISGENQRDIEALNGEVEKFKV